MRVLKEFTHDPMKVSYYSWNNKFMVKIEYGPYEQWFKFSHEDYTLEEIDNLLDSAFYSKAEARFIDMHNGLKEAYGRHKK